MASLHHQRIAANSRSVWSLLQGNSSDSGELAGALLEVSLVAGSEPAGGLNYTTAALERRKGAPATSETVSSESTASIERFRLRGDLDGRTGREARPLNGGDEKRDDIALCLC